MDALVFGSVIADITVFANNVKKIKVGRKNYFGLDYGSKTEINKMEIGGGGSGHNVAYGLTKMERKVGLMGSVGNDVFSYRLFFGLKKIGIDTKYLINTKKYHTGVSIVIIGKDNERSILISNGANDFLNAYVDDEYINNFRWFIFTSVVGDKPLETLERTIKVAKRKRLKIVANPSIRMVKSRKRQLIEMMKMSDIAIMNEEEAMTLTGKKEVTACLRSIRSIGPTTVVITLGGKGVVALQDDRIYKQKAYAVKAVDTTGAGDAFTVGFMHSLMRRDSIEYALKFGCACSALNVKSYGAVKAFPKEDDIIKMIGESNV